MIAALLVVSGLVFLVGFTSVQWLSRKALGVVVGLSWAAVCWAVWWLK